MISFSFDKDNYLNYKIISISFRFIKLLIIFKMLLTVFINIFFIVLHLNMFYIYLYIYNKNEFKIFLIFI